MPTASPTAAEPISEREFVITRAFDAPARLLFEAFSKPQHVLQWFGPPGYPLALCEMDFRPGGRYRFAMKGPDGKLMMPFGGEYLEIIPHRKVSYSNAFETPGAETMIVTFLYDEKDGRTTLTVHTLFASVAQKAHHVGMGYAQGVMAGLDQLEGVARRMESA
jgi:uncharacterized protein YndB with AHSA1/START domain